MEVNEIISYLKSYDIGQDRVLALQDGPGNEVLRGDHLQSLALTVELSGEDGGDVGIELGQGQVVEGGAGGTGHGSPRVGTAAPCGAATSAQAGDQVRDGRPG